MNFQAGLVGGEFDLQRHIEAYCGPEPSAVHLDERSNVWAARFDDTPGPGLCTFISTGLSVHLLKQPKSGTAIRQELLVCVATAFRDLPWHELLLGVARESVSSHQALALGLVLGPSGPLFPERPDLDKLTAFLCAGPAFFPDGFGSIQGERSTLIFVELIPITTGEAKEIARSGWRPFFDRADNGGVDILSLTRAG